MYPLVVSGEFVVVVAIRYLVSWWESEALRTTGIQPLCRSNFNVVRCDHCCDRADRRAQPEPSGLFRPKNRTPSRSRLATSFQRSGRSRGSELGERLDSLAISALVAKSFSFDFKILLPLSIIYFEVFTMRGVYCDGKSIKRLERLPDPILRAGETLIKVRQVGICETDLQLAQGYMNFRGILGHEFVGETTDGRRVTAEINNPCHLCPTCRDGRQKPLSKSYCVGHFESRRCHGRLGGCPHSQPPRNTRLD